MLNLVVVQCLVKGFEYNSEYFTSVLMHQEARCEYFLLLFISYFFAQTNVLIIEEQLWC